MTFDHPTAGQIPGLLQLWKNAFGEYNGFWELFLETGFRPDHCRCITLDSRPAAAMCWFDCECRGQKLAYLYAVVTHPGHRGQGLCRRLLEDVRRHLSHRGYAAIILVPADGSLRQMYRKLGFRDCTSVAEFSCTASHRPIPLRAIGPGEYAALRRQFLPELGVIQEQENLTFLARQAQFYTGPQVLLAAYREADTLQVMELLGDSAAAGDILAALECQKGHFRTPGAQMPFAMLLPLQEDAVIPEYFGFAFD